MEILNAILAQFRAILWPWWIAIGLVALLLLVFRHKREQLVGDLLIVYVITILASTVFSRAALSYTEPDNPINLDLVGTWVERLGGDFYSRSELLLNFCMLLPLGVLFPWATKRSFGMTVLAGLLLILLIEFAQLLTRRGWFELSDIVDNIIGVMIGYLLYRIGEAVWRRLKC